MSSGQSSSHERWIGWTLRLGVFLSALLLLLGLLAGASQIKPLQQPPHNLDLEQFLNVITGKHETPVGEFLLYAGLLILVFTPIVRVLTAVTIFIRERDWKFSIVAASVFVALMVEFIFAFV